MAGNLSQSNRINMIKANLCLIVLTALVGLSRTSRVDYAGFTVLRCLPQNQNQLRDLEELQVEADSIKDLDFWTPATRTNSSVDIMAGPRQLKTLREWLKRRVIDNEVMIQDVGYEIDQTMPPQSLVRQFSNISMHAYLLAARNYFREYQRYEAIEAKLKSLENLDQRIVVQTIGESFENRKLYLVKVSNDHEAKKPVILIDAGHHAREWISHSTLMYLLESLVNIDLPRISNEECTLDSCRDAVKERVKMDLDRFDYWFVPVINPDGYEYSHTYDRLWRKTRSKLNSYLGVCYGVDPNRNYDFHWNQAGSSPRPCSDIYAGRSAFSEPETRALASVMLENADRIKMYFSLHAFSQLILTPFGYGRVYPKDYADMEKVAAAGSKKMAMLRSTIFGYGPSSVILYPAAGGSDDFAYGKANIKYSYTLELPDRGQKGFVLPPSEIIPVGHEVALGLRAMTDKIIEIENL